MARNWPDKITTEQQALEWFRTLLFKDRLNFHPDDRGDGYVNFDPAAIVAGGTPGTELVKGGLPTFSPAEAKRYDELMGQAFEACADVYATAIQAMEEWQASGSGTIIENLQAIREQLLTNADYSAKDAARDLDAAMERLAELAEGVDGTGTADAIGSLQPVPK